MARIGEDEIERLKMEIAVERLAEARGIALKKHGSDLHWLCPFHDDREPVYLFKSACDGVLHRRTCGFSAQNRFQFSAHYRQRCAQFVRCIRNETPCVVERFSKARNHFIERGSQRFDFIAGT